MNLGSRRPRFRGIGAAPASGRGRPNPDPNGKGAKLGKRGNTKWQYQSSSPEGAANPPFLIQFKPMDMVEYEGSMLEEFQAGVFYVPMPLNQVTFDSFILVGHILYIFQFTVAASYDIEQGIMKFFSQVPLRDQLQGAEWQFFLLSPLGRRSCAPNQTSRS